MKPKHTPGPWKVENHTEHVGPYTSAALEIWNQNRHITTVHEHVDSFDVDKANAHLIAAAPELLETLEKSQRWLMFILDAWQLDHDQRDRINGFIEIQQKTIVKAKGGTK